MKDKLTILYPIIDTTYFWWVNSAKLSLRLTELDRALLGKRWSLALGALDDAALARIREGAS